MWKIFATEKQQLFLAFPTKTWLHKRALKHGDSIYEKEKKNLTAFKEYHMRF